MATILLVGDDAALVEGLAQALAAHGHASLVARTLPDARELSRRHAPLVAVVARNLAAAEESLGLTLAAGGAMVLYHSAESPEAVLGPRVRRSVLADLALPLERNRLVALVHRVEERAQVVGRERRNTPPESTALR